MPEYNRVVNKKWQTYNRRLHKQKILESKPLVDTSEPSCMRYPIIKNKKDMFQDGKLIVKISILH